MIYLHIFFALNAIFYCQNELFFVILHREKVCITSN